MRKLSRFEKFGLVAAVVIACTFFYMKRVYEPQEKVLKKTVRTLNKVIGEANSLNEAPSAASVKRTLKKRRQELAGLEEQLKGTSVRTGAAREVTQLQSDIHRLLEDSGMGVNAVVPRGTVRDRDKLFDWTLFEIDMNGRFFAFMNFLRAARDMKDPVRIESIRLEAVGREGLHITLALMI